MTLHKHGKIVHFEWLTMYTGAMGLKRAKLASYYSCSKLSNDSLVER